MDEEVKRFLEVIRSLPESRREALRRVCEEGYGSEVYLKLEDQAALSEQGLIELTPGRKSQSQPNKFAVCFDARCTAPRDVKNAWDLWYLETNEGDVDFEELVRRGHYDHKLGDFHADARRYLAECGVPESYIERVYDHAYEQGHSSGYTEILNEMYGLIHIFDAPKDAATEASIKAAREENETHTKGSAVRKSRKRKSV